MTHAALVGLLVQAAVATTLLRFWLQHRTSFYLLDLGGAGTPLYVAQLVAWPLSFVLLCLGHKRDAAAFAALAGFLAVVNFVLDAVLGNDRLQGELAVGMTLLGLVPAVCLLVSRGYRLPGSRRAGMIWLATLVALALAMNLLVPNPFRGTLVEVLDDLWGAGLVLGLLAWWRAPWMSLAVALLTMPILVIRSAPGGGISLSASALPAVAAALLVLLSLAGQQRLQR